MSWTRPGGNLATAAKTSRLLAIAQAHAMADNLVTVREPDVLDPGPLLDCADVLGLRDPKLTHLRCWIAAREGRIADALSEANALLGSREGSTDPAWGHLLVARTGLEARQGRARPTEHAGETTTPQGPGAHRAPANRPTHRHFTPDALAVKV